MTETSKITRDEVIEAIMEELWEDLGEEGQAEMIAGWLEDTGFELVD